MRTGPIAAEPRSERLDRSGEVFELWEAGPGRPVGLPYRPAGEFADRARRLIGTCRSAVVAIGSTPSSSLLLKAVLDAATVGSRIYVYAGNALTQSEPEMQRLAAMSELVLPRFGPPPPADWIVANGTSGLLLFGPPGGDRRWFADVEREIARSLLQAFAVLFWHHARQEGLPDATGRFAPRPPLPPPVSPSVPAPGPDVELAAGRFWVGGEPPPSIPDAEIRVLPSRAAGETASLVFLPPTPASFAHPSELAARGARVVWADLGLPKTAVSIERMVVDFADGPIGLQLEWPKPDAIRLLQSLKAAAAAPLFEYHPGRRLDASRNPVLLPGWSSPRTIADSLEVNLGNIEAPLDAFDTVRPDLTARVAEPALAVDFVWRAVPAVPPLDAREAAIVRQWRVLDEWGARTVATCRTLLERIARAGGNDAAGLGFSAGDSLDRLVVIAQAPLSRDQSMAARTTQDLRDLAQMLHATAVAAVAARRASLMQEEEVRQRATWDRKRDAAAGDLQDHTATLARQEREAARLSEELTTIDGAFEATIREARDRRRTELESRSARIVEERNRARDELIEADRDAPGGRASKAVRKVINVRIQALDQEAAAVRKDLAALDRWSPPPDAVGDVRQRRQQIQRELEELRLRARETAQLSERLGRAADEAFEFRPPPVPASAPVPQAGDPPAVPDEALPEIGELLEHQGRRYLVIKTWSQLAPARPVAQRLGAALVSANRPV